MAHSGWLSHAMSMLVLAAGIGPAVAGPPYQSDDPEPTDFGHFEIYSFDKGAFGRSGSSSASGLDFNYGAAPDLQLTAVVPFGYDAPSDGPSAFGPGNVELAAKYKLIHQDTLGLDVSVFPRVFLPSPSQTGDPYASILVPIWLQKDWGSTSAFGGGGCQFSFHDTAKNFCLYGATVTRQVFNDLQLGVEVFHQTSDGNGAPPSTTLGIGARYDLSDHYHLLGYVARGLENVSQTGSWAWYASVLFTY
jgi:hypothetical protein